VQLIAGVRDEIFVDLITVSIYDVKVRKLRTMLSYFVQRQ
jgi:hypothetical protein